ncbi:hypothetical protein FMEAI12_4660032 [Parafrankia sp. Ea1.12]|uniref:hypothetical protein n=1 Tax=Parafrankia sp. Ea1.12 TaxID=573499 RepID=UPI000DA5A805|nr:hypothetical protein [Parafrankia sp. Ea1.12]SQD98480.1 hypothetical protein FMEAI12_4660032 [Parafrankia sp. Ea1.12]
MTKRAVGSVPEPVEEGSQPRIADRIGQRTGETFSAEYPDVPGMKAARRGVDRLSQTKPVRGVGRIVARREADQKSASTTGRLVELLRHYSENLGLLNDLRWLPKVVENTDGDDTSDEPDLCDQPNGRRGGGS